MKPVVKRVWHGSDTKFSAFERRSSKRFVLFSEFDVESPAFFFAVTPEEAREYGRHVSEWKISVTRPFVNAETERHLSVDPLDDRRLRELAKVLRPLVQVDRRHGPFVDLGVQRYWLKDQDWPYIGLSTGGEVAATRLRRYDGE
jgi:hypothetical protein